MNCFRHSSDSAVGTCKNCQKGLCPSCAIDVGDGLACRESCETAVREVNEMNERGKKIYGIGRYKSRAPASGVLMWLVLSVGLWAAAIVLFLRTGEIEPVTLVTAGIFTCILVIAYWSSRRTGLQC